MDKILSLLGNSSFYIAIVGALFLGVMGYKVISLKSDVKAQKKANEVLSNKVASQAQEIAELNLISIQWEASSKMCQESLRSTLDMLSLFSERESRAQRAVSEERKKLGALRDSINSSIPDQGDYGPYQMLRDVQKLR